MKKLAILFFAISLLGCANFLSTTANRGIGYGMNQDTVARINEKKGYKIISRDENNVVVDGMQEQLKVPAIKTFYFENNKLVAVNEKMK